MKLADGFNTFSMQHQIVFVVFQQIIVHYQKLTFCMRIGLFQATGIRVNPKLLQVERDREVIFPQRH